MFHAPINFRLCFYGKCVNRRKRCEKRLSVQKTVDSNLVSGVPILLVKRDLWNVSFKRFQFAPKFFFVPKYCIILGVSVFLLMEKLLNTRVCCFVTEKQKSCNLNLASDVSVLFVKRDDWNILFESFHVITKNFFVTKCCVILDISVLPFMRKHVNRRSFYPKSLKFNDFGVWTLKLAPETSTMTLKRDDWNILFKSFHIVTKNFFVIKYCIILDISVLHFMRKHVNRRNFCPKSLKFNEFRY